VHRLALQRPALLAALALAVLAGFAGAGPLPEFDAASAVRPPADAVARARAAGAQPAVSRLARVQSTDARYGVPSFVWASRPSIAAGVSRGAPRRTADAAARAHLGDLAPLYGLQRGDIANARLANLHDTGRGAVIASYRQVIDGIEVFRDEFKVCMDRELEMVSVSGYLPSLAAAPARAADAFPLASGRAVALALKDFGGLAAEPAALAGSTADEAGYERFESPASMRGRTDGLAVSNALRARKVWFHLGSALEPAYYVEVMGETAAYAYVYSARDGRLLFRHGLMQDAAYAYRVWANTAAPNMPMDGPQGDGASPHPTGVPNLYQPALVAPNLVALQNGPISTNDPWLPPAATQTTGNNVDAYVDLSAPDGFSAGDFRATTTSVGTFDRTYDTNQNPGVSGAQRMAAVTTLFYINNYLHDMFYDSGFDEAAGNAQTDNFGRGGLGGDPILAEGQDYSGTNNANMATPADGGSPRMQMYLFNPPGGANLVVNTPAGIAGTYSAGTAAFGPLNFALAGQVVAGQDASAPVDDACSAITSVVAGKIALIDRGTCSFVVKVQNAQTAGAIGAIIVNNAAGSTPPGMGGSSGTITIPSLSVTQADGALIRAQLGAGVTVTMNRPVQLQRDGTIDGTIVAHEWGHHVSNRLIGDASGLSNQQGGGMGEGWSDFFALLMTVRPGDNLAACFAVGAYALSGNVIPTNAYYFAIRRYPFSTDMTKNPLTFRHIANGQALPAGPPLNGDPSGANNAEVHATGEVWCTMLWECYAALLGDTGRLTFDQAQGRMKLYLIGGLELTPNAPTFVEARDAILAAALANDPADFALMAQAFARRGMGTGAVAPPRSSMDNVGVTESFALGGDLAIASVTLDDDLHSCDFDSYLDNGERGTLSIGVVNSGATPLAGTTVTVTSPNPSVTFPAGNVRSAAGTSPFAAVGVTVPVELNGASPGELVEFDVAVNDPGLLVAGPRLGSLSDYVHVDEALFPYDLAEAHHTTWTYDAAAGSAGSPWGRVETAPGEHAYHVDDAGDIADLRLVTPPLSVSPSDPFMIIFTHRWWFEFDSGADYDGGVIELTNNGGASWIDIGASTSPGYGGSLFSGSGNPLGGRPAWTKTSAGFPSLVSTTVNLGTAYAGQTVRIRFRHAADAGVGAPGWWIDNLSFSGIVSPVFLGLADELGTCEPLAVGDTRPAEVGLSMAGGNPAHGPARLRFALPGARRVQLTVHDLAGRLVATLADGEFSAGWHDAWFTRAGGGAPGAGVYFARLRVDGKQFTQRLVVIR
jgi:hypothetical protein